MTKLKRILLTGDDGYNSTGTRLLIHLLRDTYELQIAGTREQQSAVGGKISLAKGFEWCETAVDGIPALCVDGTPADATELAAAYFDQPFDLVISGLNWGVNLGTAVFGSGTVNAALRSLSVGIAPKGIAMSWDLPPKFYVMSHEEHEDIQPMLEYPGAAIAKLLEKAFAENFWGSTLLNINLPFSASSQVRFTQPIASAQDIYDYTKYHIQKNQEGKKHFAYTNQRTFIADLDASYDVKAITDQCISVTPCKFNILDDARYQEHAQLSFALPQ